MIIITPKTILILSFFKKEVKFNNLHTITFFRTYIGKWYQGGFSDYFPVYLYLKNNP